MSDATDLERFVRAQDEQNSYAAALAEMGAGEKRSHWIWYVFPQIAGLGSSAMSRAYAIKDLDEARAYLAHRVLGPRLREITRAVNQHASRSAHDIFWHDAIKFHSCVTLFSLAASDESDFRQALDLFFKGENDEHTEKILAAQGHVVVSRPDVPSRHDLSTHPFGPLVGAATTWQRPLVGAPTAAPVTDPMTDPAIQRARRLVEAANKVVVLTGAGVSTASGIADYRGPEGVWTKDPSAERLSNIRDFVASPDVRRAAWRRELHQRSLDAQPNAAHVALVAFERSGKLSALVTQNIDGLHLASGSSADVVFEVHGSSRTTSCLRCGATSPTSLVLERVAAGDDDPHCPALLEGVDCDGLLKTDVVSFGQMLPIEVFARAEFLTKSCDLLICVGSTLSVAPVSGLVDKALSRGKRLVIINAESTAFDAEADVVVRGDIVTVLSEVLAAP